MILLTSIHRSLTTAASWLLLTICCLLLVLAIPGGSMAQDKKKDDKPKPEPAEDSKDKAPETKPADDEATPPKEDTVNVAEAQAPVPIVVPESEIPDTGFDPGGGQPVPPRDTPEQNNSPAPAGISDGGSWFSAEERAALGLPPVNDDIPGFAEGEPGFIPDTSPDDLFTTPGNGRSFVFETLLGDPRLPHQDSQSLISRFSRDPSDMLEENQARIVVPTGSITGSTESKQFRIDGGLTLFYSDVSMKGDYADIDEKNEVAVIHGNVSIVDPKYTMKTDELRIYFEAKQFQAKGFVQFKKDASKQSDSANSGLEKKDRLREDFAGEEFELFCKDLFYDWGTKEMTALDSVRLVHPSFNGTMERIDYNDETKEYEMSGSVVLDITDYGWVFDNDLVEEDDIDKVQALTDSNTKIICDRLVYSEESGIAKFYSLPGSQVIFDQGSRKIQASFIEVNDQTKDFHAEGTEVQPVAYEQDDGEWMFLGGLVNPDEVSQELVDTLGERLTINAGTFTYNFDRKRLELIGNVKINGGGKSIDAAVMVQDETAKFLLLRGNVHIKPDATSEIVAAQVYIDTENDVFTFVGLVEGKLESDDLIPSEDDSATGPDEIKIQQGVFSQSGAPGAATRGRGNNVAPNR